MRRVAIVGLGLLGGSIALGLREARPDVRIVGIDLADVIARASVARFVDERFELADLARALRGADLAILCAPVRVIADQVELALEHAAVVTDCGSTKRLIGERAERSAHRARFVPGHPLAGGPEGGAERARPDLFRGRRWILCPEGSEPQALARVEDLVCLLGAESIHMSAEAHDFAVALTSHVPQLLAGALLAQASERGALAARGPSFDAATRVVSGNAAMWRDVFETNSDAISQALAGVRGELDAARRGLEQRPPDVGPALELLARARGTRGS